jgi:hypothetical protein
VQSVSNACLNARLVVLVRIILPDQGQFCYFHVMKASTMLERHVVRCLRPCHWPPCKEAVVALVSDLPSARSKYCSDEHRFLAHRRRRMLKSSLNTIDRELASPAPSVPHDLLRLWRRNVAWELATYEVGIGDGAQP